MHWNMIIKKIIVPFAVVLIIIYLLLGRVMFLCDCFWNRFSNLTIFATWLALLISAILIAKKKKKEWKMKHTLLVAFLYVVIVFTIFFIGQMLYVSPNSNF